MNFQEQIRCILSEETSFETLTPIGSHANEDEYRKRCDDDDLLDKIAHNDYIKLDNIEVYVYVSL